MPRRKQESNAEGGGRSTMLRRNQNSYAKEEAGAQCRGQGRSPMTRRRHESEAEDEVGV